MKDVLRFFNMKFICKLQIILLMLTFVPVGAESSSGTLIAPGKPSQVGRLEIGGSTWASPSNVINGSGGYTEALINPGRNSNHFLMTGLNLNVPAGSKIQGVEFSLERKRRLSSQFGARDNSIRIVKNSGGVPKLVGSNKALYEAWPNNFQTVTYGSPTDKWGQLLTVADINSVDFGFAVSAKTLSNETQRDAAQIKSASVKVYYQPNTSPGLPVIVGPNNVCTSNNNPDFSWSSSVDLDGDAVRYELEISKDSNFQEVIFNGITDLTNFSNGTQMDDDTYFWRVRALDDYGQSAWQNASFSVDSSAPVLSGLGLSAAKVSQSWFSKNDLLLNYQLSESSLVKIELFLEGELIREIVSIVQNQGDNNISWDGLDSLGQVVSPGKYTIKFTAQDDAQNVSQEEVVFEVTKDLPIDSEVIIDDERIGESPIAATPILIAGTRSGLAGLISNVPNTFVSSLDKDVKGTTSEGADNTGDVEKGEVKKSELSGLLWILLIIFLLVIIYLNRNRFKGKHLKKQK